MNTLSLPSVPVAVVGGSGLYRLFDEQVDSVRISTPYGDPSGPIRIGTIDGRRVAFLARHGEDHSVPPHRVNYRANLWALARLGTRAIITSAAVGGLSDEAATGRLIVPDQIIDRTWGRPDTFYDRDDVQHLAAADPFCPGLRRITIDVLRQLGEDVLDRGTSVVVQGPRFSTRAESAWFRAAGADIVNMTHYPEAVLAAELNISLANLSFVTDRDAGSRPGEDDAADAGLVLRRMAEAAPRILAAVRAIAAAVPDGFEPRRLIAQDAVERTMCLAVAEAGEQR
jgi:5'-methylthioadenosine phosphorylase